MAEFAGMISGHSPEPTPPWPPVDRATSHWQGCWKVHHACAVALLERILASDTWADECAELGCTDEDHTGRSEGDDAG